jgi:hypothetical protein
MDEVPKNDAARRKPGGHQIHNLSAEYRLLTFLSKLTGVLSKISGAVFWWSEQKHWRIADKLEQLEEEARQQ